VESILVFIDCEFTPDTRRWLSLGAVAQNSMFYAETADPEVLALASREFGENVIGSQVLGQLGQGRHLPGAVQSPAAMARAFDEWTRACAGQQPVYICYDYSVDIALLEQGFEEAGITWPEKWEPGNLAILNEDPTADAARLEAWAQVNIRYGLRRHHALADAVALQAAYFVQTCGYAQTT
jgi:hypothetical protein